MVKEKETGNIAGRRDIEGRQGIWKGDREYRRETGNIEKRQ